MNELMNKLTNKQTKSALYVTTSVYKFIQIFQCGHMPLNRFKLFRRAVTDTGCVNSVDTAGLRYRDSSLSTGSSNGQTTVGA